MCSGSLKGLETALNKRFIQTHWEESQRVYLLLWKETRFHLFLNNIYIPPCCAKQKKTFLGHFSIQKKGFHFRFLILMKIDHCVDAKRNLNLTTKCFVRWHTTRLVAFTDLNFWVRKSGFHWKRYLNCYRFRAVVGLRGLLESLEVCIENCFVSLFVPKKQF